MTKFDYLALRGFGVLMRCRAVCGLPEASFAFAVIALALLEVAAVRWAS
jgi:hypothetical protein